nr:hypothetical protein Iba_chr05dCG9790 [Ipomoea batatas]
MTSCPAAIADMRESSPANTAPATIAANRLELAPDGGDNVGGVGVESPKSTGHGRANDRLSAAFNPIHRRRFLVGAKVSGDSDDIHVREVGEEEIQYVFGRP